METRTMIMIYVVGVILTLLFWIKFGKKLGFDYSGPKTYVNYDDWSSNAEAWTAWSLFWPITNPIFLFFGLISLLTKAVDRFIEKDGR